MSTDREMSLSERMHRIHQINQREAKARADRMSAFYQLLAVIIVLLTSIAAVVIAA